MNDCLFSQTNQIPIDGIGCFSNFSHAWVHDYLISHQNENYKNRKNTEYRPSVEFPHFNACDSADVNGKRLLGIYKDEKQSHGKHGSMMKIIWNFCKTRVLVASFFWTLSTIFSLLAPVVFLKLTLDVLEVEANERNTNAANETITIKNNLEPKENNNIYLFKLFEFQLLSFYGRFTCASYMLAFIVCLYIEKILHNITLWLNLRTSIRIRTGVLSATYRKIIKSSVVNNIAPHQILTDDVLNDVMELVNHLTKIVGTFVAIFLTLFASVFLLGNPGVWPIFACIGFFCVPIVLAKISTNRLKKCSHYLQKKITLIIDFVLNFKSIKIHSLSYEYIKRFYCE